jgi:hypothetical protein
VQAWPFSGRSSSGPPSYRPTVPRPSDPARPGMGSVRSVIHARFRSPISRVPFALNLLSRKGSPGCSLRCVHEASDFSHFPTSFARKGTSRLLVRIDGLRDGGDWKANGNGEIAADKTSPSKSGNWPPGSPRGEPASWESRTNLPIARTCGDDFKASGRPLPSRTRFAMRPDAGILNQTSEK